MVFFLKVSLVQDSGFDLLQFGGGGKMTQRA